MDLRKASQVFSTLFTVILIIPPLPTSAWMKSNRGNERDVMMKSSYRDDSFQQDEFHKDSGLMDDSKEGGRGFFYFEKGGKKLVGYMDYGDDEKKKGDPWQTEKDNVMTYSIPSSWSSDDDNGKKDDNVFEMVKPTSKSKMYYFSNNQQIKPGIMMKKPTIIHTHMHGGYQPRKPMPMRKQQPQLQTQSKSSYSGYNMPDDEGGMFDHGYSKNDKDMIFDIDKMRDNFNKEFNKVNVNNRDKWEDDGWSDRPSKSKPRFEMMRVQTRPKRQEMRPWKPRPSRNSKPRMSSRNRMMESKPRRSFRPMKNSFKDFAPQPTRRRSDMRPSMMRRQKMRRMPMKMKKVQLVYESDDRKGRMEQVDNDYDGKVYLMLPKSSGKPKGALGDWINSDFFTDTFIESFHPSSINDKHARQARLPSGRPTRVPTARILKLVPYYPRHSQYVNHNYKV